MCIILKSCLQNNDFTCFALDVEFLLFYYTLNFNVISFTIVISWIVVIAIVIFWIKYIVDAYFYYETIEEIFVLFRLFEM